MPRPLRPRQLATARAISTCWLLRPLREGCTAELIDLRSGQRWRLRLTAPMRRLLAARKGLR